MAPLTLSLDDAMAMAEEDLEAMIASEFATEPTTKIIAEGNNGKAT